MCKLYVAHTLPILTIIILSNKCSLCYNTNHVRKLLRT